MSFLHDASRCAVSRRPLYGKGNSQNRSAVFLGTLKGMLKAENLHSLLHTCTKKPEIVC